MSNNSCDIIVEHFAFYWSIDTTVWDKVVGKQVVHDGHTTVRESPTTTVLKPRKQAYSFLSMVLYNLRLTTFGLQNRRNLCELAQVPTEVQHLRRRYP